MSRVCFFAHLPQPRFLYKAIYRFTREREKGTGYRNVGYKQGWVKTQQTVTKQIQAHDHLMTKTGYQIFNISDSEEQLQT